MSASRHVFQAVAAGRNSGSEPAGRVSGNRSIYNRQITTWGSAPVAIRQVLRRFLLQPPGGAGGDHYLAGAAEAEQVLVSSLRTAATIVVRGLRWRTSER
jgi:hypothetical protein